MEELVAEKGANGTERTTVVMRGGLRVDASISEEVDAEHKGKGDGFMTVASLSPETLLPQCVRAELARQAAALEASGKSPLKDEQSISDAQDSNSFKPEGGVNSTRLGATRVSDFKLVKHPEHTAPMYRSERTGETYALGLLPTPPGMEVEPTTFVTLQALPASYDPFTQDS